MLHTFPLHIDFHKRHSSIEHCLIFCKPEVSSSAAAMEHVKASFAEHSLQIAFHGRLSGAEIKARRIIEGQYPALQHFACVCPPADIELSVVEQKQFRMAFASLQWEEALQTSSVFNAVDAAQHLKIDSSALYELWERAEACIRLRRGLYVARLDRNCAADAAMRKKLNRPIYVVNGFYHAMVEQYCGETSCIEFFVCEWDEAQTSWSQLLEAVVGPSDPTAAPARSLRGSIAEQWAALGLQTAPTAARNCVHVSDSAFSGLAERLLWKKGSMLYTDLFGSRLLSARLKSTQVSEWARNPLVGDRPLLEHLHALNSADCTEYLLKLGNKQK